MEAEAFESDDVKVSASQAMLPTPRVEVFDATRVAGSPFIVPAPHVCEAPALEEHIITSSPSLVTDAVIPVMVTVVDEPRPFPNCAT